MSSSWRGRGWSTTTRSPSHSAISCGGAATGTCAPGPTSSATASSRTRAGAIAQVHAQGDAEAAREMVGSRFGPPPYDEATIRRAAGLLARRGFDEDTVGAVLGVPD